MSTAHLRVVGVELDGEDSVGVPGGRARAVATAPLQRGYLVLSCLVVYVHLQSASRAQKMFGTGEQRRNRGGGENNRVLASAGDETRPQNNGTQSPTECLARYVLWGYPGTFRGMTATIRFGTLVPKSIYEVDYYTHTY